MSNPARAYPIPSCNACFRIAERAGLSVGMDLDDGKVEGFTHADGEVQALVFTPQGFLLPVSLPELRRRGYAD